MRVSEEKVGSEVLFSTSEQDDSEMQPSDK